MNARQQSAQQPESQQTESQQRESQQRESQQPESQQPESQQTVSQQPVSQQSAQQPESQQSTSQQLESQQPVSQQPVSQSPVHRNRAVDIAKGIAIITVVIAHAEMPGLLNRAIYLFHMPLFFITAGYFFNAPKVEQNPWDFLVKRFKGLYVPFVKWSVFFLLIHNLLFGVGVLNESYGNWTGGVTHPYTWHQGVQRLVNIVFSMGGYDEFLCGAYWFFRGLLMASLAYMVCWLLLSRIRLLRHRPLVAALIIMFFAWALAFSKVGEGWKIVTLVQGGYRDIMGTMFFAVGFIYRYLEKRIGHSLWIAAAGAIVLLVASYFGCAGMTLKPTIRDVFTLFFTGIAGWLMTYNVSYHLLRLKRLWWLWLDVCGRLSLYIFIWHVAAYKVVSLIKIWWYDLDYLQIGCHMVIHHNAAHDLFWLWYTMAGVGIPVAGYYLYFRAIKPAILGFFTRRGMAISI